jgi:hypothetical protein
MFVVLLLSLLLHGCREKEDLPERTQPRGYLELIQAYELGMVFSSAEYQPYCCIVKFENGFQITVSDTSIQIHDCTDSKPEQVFASGGWWKVGELVKPIKVESGLARHEAYPVYVYFDARTLHMWISNGEHLVFDSVASRDEEEEKKEQQELERRQNIPVVRIQTAGGAGIYDKENYVKGRITISDPEKLYSDVDQFSASMGIRGRGNSTWSWPKKPWKVKLDEKASLLGMPADKEWALLANYADRTLIRNIVAMKISEICGFSWTPRMRSVEVYLNGEYQGVYTLCEHKKVSKDRVNIDKKNDFYFEIEESMDEKTVWWTSMGVPMMFSEPEIPTPEQFDRARRLFDDFEAALHSSDTDAYEEYVDVDSFINYYIIQELTKNVDGNFRKSSFLTKEQGGKLEMYHVWDFDLTLGNCGYYGWDVGNGPENFWIKDFASNCTPGDNWVNLMMRDPDFIIRLQDRWNELMPELERIPDFIDEQALTLDKAVKRNFQRWNIWDWVDWVKMPSLGSYEKEVAYLKEFYSDRLEWLDRELNKL